MNQVKYASMQHQWMKCPACDSADFRLLARVDRYAMGIPTCQCSRCGFAMTNPLPTEEALSQFYRDDYRLYYRKVDTPSEQHIEEYGLAARAKYTSAFLRDAGLLPARPRVLDMGCAEGSLLRAIRALAPEATLVGIEPNPKFGEYARQNAGATVYRSLDEVEATGQRFDLITINHVLEHLREPVKMLQRLSALGDAGSAIYVDVPDAARYSSIDDLHIAHLLHFSAASLRNVAGRAGLSPAKLERHSPTRHPLSVRGVFVRSTEPFALAPDAEAELVRKRIRRIAMLMPAIAFRRSALGQALLNGPLKIWRKLRAA